MQQHNFQDLIANNPDLDKGVKQVTCADGSRMQFIWIGSYSSHVTGYVGEEYIHPEMERAFTTIGDITMLQSLNKLYEGIWVHYHSTYLLLNEEGTMVYRLSYDRTVWKVEYGFGSAKPLNCLYRSMQEAVDAAKNTTLEDIRNEYQLKYAYPTRAIKESNNVH